MMYKRLVSECIVVNAGQLNIQVPYKVEKQFNFQSVCFLINHFKVFNCEK